MANNFSFAGKWSFKTAGSKYINLADTSTGAMNLAEASMVSPNPQYFNAYGDPNTGLWLQSEANRNYITYSAPGYLANQSRGHSDLAIFTLELVSGTNFRIVQNDGDNEFYLNANGVNLERIAKTASPPATTEFTQTVITAAQPPGTSSQINLIGVYLASVDITKWSSTGKTMISDSDLSYADFSGAIIKDVNFTFSKLDGTNFSNTDLAGTNFAQVTGNGTIFTGVTLHGTTSFSSATFNQSHFDKARNAVANPSTNEGAKFNGAFKATHSIFNGSNLAGSTFSGDLTSSQFIGVNMENSVLTFANFTDCVMTMISFAGKGENSVTAANNCKFDGATLANAVFDAVNLQASTFINANLTNAHLNKILGNIGIDISGANLTGAILTGLNLSKNPPANGGNGGNVTLSAETNFTKAQMNDVDLSNHTLDNNNFMAASMQNAKLTSCSFNNSILVGTDLTNATFSANTSFKEANLSNAVLSSCDLTGAIFSAEASGKNAAILTNVYMPNAILTDAKLYAVNMSGCSWYGPASKATNAQMEQVNLSNANISTLDLSSSVMIGATLTFANLVNTNFTNVNLSPTSDNRAASLAFASLQGANFTQAELVAADLTNAAVSLNIQSSSGDIYGSPAFIVEDGNSSIIVVTTDLNQLIIDEYLISQFAANNVEISKTSGVSILSTGIWIIRTDGGQQYILVYGQNNIQVYKELSESTAGDTKIPYGAFVAVPLFQLAINSVATLNAGVIDNALKTAFSNSGYVLLDYANITIVKKDDRWAIANRDPSSQVLQSGYAQFVLLSKSIASGSINYIEVYGTNPLMITRLMDDNKLTTTVMNFNTTTVFNNSIMSPGTTCPSGLKFSLLDNGVTYEELMTAGLPPGPPTCIPSPTHFC